MLDGIIKRLSAISTLDADDVAALRDLPTRAVRVPAHTTLISERQVITECCLLVAGYACRHKVASDGGRQIVSFHIPGDVLDAQHLLLDRADHNVQTITAAELEFVPIKLVQQLLRERPAIAFALWRQCLIDASIFREWVLNVGRRNAKMRIAHMLCEFLSRHEAAGLGEPETMNLPMTQEQIGDATGLTTVHVNRMLRELRQEGVIGGAGRQIVVNDWRRLQKVADFHPAYLHQAA